MTLEDHESGKTIINPFITLYSPEDAWVALNTETFGENAQREIIHVLDEKNYIEARDAGFRMYKVVATAGKQNETFGYEKRNMLALSRTVRTDGADDAIALVPLGYLLDDVVRKNFPKSYIFFENVREKRKK